MKNNMLLKTFVTESKFRKIVKKNPNFIKHLKKF